MKVMKTTGDVIQRDGGITNDNAEEISKLPVGPATEDSPEVPVTVVEVPHPALTSSVPCMVPVPQKVWTSDEMSLIKAKVAGNATDTEFALLMYLAKEYGLDPLAKQIWLVKYGDAPAQIFAGRDGYLAIAQRSGQLDGFESGTDVESVVKVNSKGEPETKSELVGWCRIKRKDMSTPFYGKVYFSEYTTGKNLWLSKPRVMIQKVAESVLLRKAFSVSGLYSPEEMGQ